MALPRSRLTMADLLAPHDTIPRVAFRAADCVRDFMRALDIDAPQVRTSKWNPINAKRQVPKPTKAGRRLVTELNLSCAVPAPPPGPVNSSQARGPDEFRRKTWAAEGSHHAQRPPGTSQAAILRNSTGQAARDRRDTPFRRPIWFGLDRKRGSDREFENNIRFAKPAGPRSRERMAIA